MLLALKSRINLNKLELYKYYITTQKIEQLRENILTKEETFKTHTIFAFDKKTACAYTKKITPDHWIIVNPESEELLATFSKQNGSFDFTIHISNPFIPDNALLMMAAILQRKNNTFMGRKQDYDWIGAGLLGSLSIISAVHLFMSPHPGSALYPWDHKQKEQFKSRYSSCPHDPKLFPSQIQTQKNGP